MRTTTVSLFWLFCLACSGAARADTLPRVIESFEVGANVYARALTVESKKNVLWVGTSAGVHEISIRHTQGAQHLHPAPASWRTNTCSPSASTRMATSGSAPMPAASRATATVSGRPISPCTGWPIIGFTLSPTTARESVDRHLGRGQPGRPAHHEVQHLCEGADQ